jgi:acetyltransferase-like isoleucine patch superfamily enzyme
MTEQSALLTALRALLFDLRKQARDTHKRHVSIGDLMADRWDIAREHGFGDGTSCYDNVLILGSVTVGKHCWIGPNVILDGSGGLSVGDYVDISAGVQIYTHDTVRRATSGGKEPVEYAQTRIGSRVYIGPQTIIQKGVTIGDGVTIGAMSLVSSDIPAGAKAWGVPARLQTK